jgi:flavin-dependent dehydrogenase
MTCGRRLRYNVDMSKATHGSHAIVIGAGIAGLLAARVLANHFASVTLVERDRLPSAPKPRAGAPQAAHGHVLLLRGLQVLESLFSGLSQELIDRGAPIVDMAQDVAWLTPAGWGIRFAGDLHLLSCSRDLLEWAIRQRLLATPGVRIQEATDVCGLVVEHERVRGIRVRARGLRSEEQEVPAALVVEASGRHSRLPDWLAAIGYDRPREDVVNGYLGYASRIYRLPHAERLDWRGAYVQPAPPRYTRGGVIFPIEGDAWLLTLAGIGGDYPPTDESGFLAFARSLRSPILADAICDAEPLTPIAGYRATENRWRRYEQLPRLPDGLMVLGDAACAFNPVYAQGMTTAALAADTLRTVLARQPHRQGEIAIEGLGRTFQCALARVNTAPWRLATSEDLRLPQTTGGRRTVAVTLLHAYFDRVIRLTTTRADVRLAFLRTMHMLDAPAVLFTPRVIAAAMRA